MCSVCNFFPSKSKVETLLQVYYMYFQAFPPSTVKRVRTESAGGVEIHIQCNRGTSQKLSSLVSNKKLL